MASAPGATDCVTDWASRSISSRNSTVSFSSGCWASSFARSVSRFACSSSRYEFSTENDSSPGASSGNSAIVRQVLLQPVNGAHPEHLYGGPGPVHSLGDHIERQPL